MPAGSAEHPPFGTMRPRKERMEGSVLGQWNELEPTAALTARDTMAVTNGVRQAMGHRHRPQTNRGGRPSLERHSSPHHLTKSGLASVHSISLLGKVLRLIFTSRLFRWCQPQETLPNTLPSQVSFVDPCLMSVGHMVSLGVVEGGGNEGLRRGSAWFWRGKSRSPSSPTRQNATRGSPELCRRSSRPSGTTSFSDRKFWCPLVSHYGL